MGQFTFSFFFLHGRKAYSYLQAWKEIFEEKSNIVFKKFTIENNFEIQERERSEINCIEMTS